jgi:hypothetical protein
MPRKPAHEAVGAADRLPAAHTFQVILASQLIELTAAISCRAEGHHQFLSVKGSFERVWTDLNHRDFQKIFFLKRRVAIDVNFDKTVWIFCLE